MTIFQDGQELTSITEGLDSDANPLLNLKAQLLLNTDSEKNKFEIHIKPSTFTPSNNQELARSFPAYATLKDSLNFYFLTMGIVERNSQGNDSWYKKRDFTVYQDNSMCPDAPKTYQSKANVLNFDNSYQGSNALTDVNRLKNANDASLSCGTIILESNDKDGGPKTGMAMGATLSFGLGLSFYYILRRLKRRNFS
jgi:hypothetical protein